MACACLDTSRRRFAPQSNGEGEDGEILNSHLRLGLYCIKADLAQINTNCRQFVESSESHSLTAKNIEGSICYPLCFWRRRRDSHSRTAFDGYTISNRARSTSYATSPYLFGFKIYYFTATKVSYHKFVHLSRYFSKKVK